MSPITFNPPPTPRGDTQQQLNDLRRWAEQITQSLKTMAAELDSGSASNNQT